MDYPIVENGIYFVRLYRAKERPMDGDMEVARYDNGLWEFIGNDIGLPMGMAVEVISKIEFPEDTYG